MIWHILLQKIYWVYTSMFKALKSSAGHTSDHKIVSMDNMYNKMLVQTILRKISFPSKIKTACLMIMKMLHLSCKKNSNANMLEKRVKNS